MTPIDDAMIDHLSQRKDTIRGTFRGSVKAGQNNDDIDDVVGDAHGTHGSEEAGYYLEVGHSQPEWAGPARPDENGEVQRMAPPRHCNITCENSQR